MLPFLIAAAVAACPASEQHSPRLKILPSAEAMAANYPPVAGAKSIDGKGVVECRIDATGAVGDCSVLSEAPADMGFGLAAMRVLRGASYQPASACGTPVAGTFKSTINFVSPAGATKFDTPEPAPEVLAAATRLIQTIGISDTIKSSLQIRWKSAALEGLDPSASDNAIADAAAKTVWDSVEPRLRVDMANFYAHYSPNLIEATTSLAATPTVVISFAQRWMSPSS